MTPEEVKPMPTNQRRRKARSRRRAVASGCVIVVGVATGVGISRASASNAPTYRTAVATTSAVSRTLSLSGTLQPVNDASADFQVSGTVDSVDVRSGEKVTAGEVIATLDDSTLKADLGEAQTTLASAQAKLTEDEEDEDTPTSTSSSGSSITDASTTAAATGSSVDAVLTAAVTTSPRSSLANDQQAVVADQHTVDTDMKTTAADLAAAESACETSSTTSTTVPSTTSTTTDSGTSSASACAEALGAASAAETQEATDQKALAAAETALANLLESDASSSSSSSTSTSGSSSANESKSASSGGATTTDTNTPEHLASDQATIDSDEASLVEAEQSFDAAFLVSPISGTVEEVDLAAGDSVTPGSSTYAVTIIDWGSYQISGTLTTADAQEVAVGQDAQITVDGVNGTFHGKVTRVGPVDDDDSSDTYPVIVAITSATTQMADGASVTAVIDVAEVSGAVVVPTSAVHTSATDDSYVYLDEAGKEVRQKVTVGLVGDVYTQITSGLSAGTVVVLANPSEAVPSSSTNTSSTDKTLAGSSNGFTGTFGGTRGGTGGGFAGAGAS
jgi:HlyD family secretion protein